MKRFFAVHLRFYFLAVFYCGAPLGVGSLNMRVVAEEIPLRGVIPVKVQEVEIVYVEGRDPKVSWKSAVTSSLLPAVRPSGPVVDLLASAGEIQPFGECTQTVEQGTHQLTLTFQTKTRGVCGYNLFLQPQAVPTDVLSYDILHVRGEASGRTTIALADEAARRRGDNVPLTTMNGRFNLRTPLELAARRLDLRRLVSLVILPEEQAGKIVLEALVLEQQRPRPNAAGLGFWIWEYREAIGQSQELLDTCRRFGCTRVVVQLPALEDSDGLWDAYRRLFDAAQERGITPLALDGAAEVIRAPEALVRKLRRLMALFTDKQPPGVQLDIEPYLLEDFFVDPETGFGQYLAVLDQVKATLMGRAPLSVVLPFWFTSQAVRGRPVTFAVMDRANEVVVMSYRTDIDELRATAEDTLRYGDLAGVPVWLAIETRPLPLERQVLLRRESRRDLADAYLDRAGRRLVLGPPPSTEEIEPFRVYRRHTIRPERLTFAGQSRKSVQAAVASIMGEQSLHPSLAGVLIHDLNGFQALAE